MILCIHWPGRHITPERIDALKAVLAEFPGTDPVELEIGHSHRLRLPDQFCVHAESSQLRRRIHCATHRQCMAHVIGYPDAF